MVKRLLTILALTTVFLTIPQAIAVISRPDEAAINNAEKILLDITPENAPQSPFGFNQDALRAEQDVVPLGQMIISTITGFLAAIAGTYAVFMILKHSYGLIASDGDSKKAEEARKAITWSVIGLLGIMFSYLIIYTVVDTLFRLGTPGRGI